MKPKPAQSDLSPAQLQIMNLLWERGEMGVAQVWEALARHRRIARNTVQTTLTRLAAKGWLRHRQDGNAFYYSAATPRKRAMSELLGRLVRTAFGGSTSGLVLSLLEDASLSDDEAALIRQMIDRARRNDSKPQSTSRKEDRS